MGQQPINGSVIQDTRDVEETLVALDQAKIPIKGPDLNSASESKFSTIKINGDNYQLRVAVNNHDNKVLPFIIPNSHLMDLQLEQNIANLDYLSGYITVYSRKLGNVIFNDELNTEFIFRGDGRDELYIDIKPLSNNSANAFPDEIWFTKLDFIVYDVQDIPGEGNHYKRIHFWHKPLYIMKTRSAPFSTADYIQSTNSADASQLNNDSRQIYTGDAIRFVLQSVGLENYIDLDNWDRGSSKIFHTSYLNNTAETEVKYLLQHHTSEEGNHPCLLYYNRGINKFQLIPIPTFFDKAVEKSGGGEFAGDYQLEEFSIFPSDMGIEDVKPKTIRHTPKIRNTRTNQTAKLADFGNIDENSFALTDISGFDSMNMLITKPVHSYNHNSKEFKMRVPDNNITNIKQYFEENYSSKLFPTSTSEPLFVLNKDKTDNIVAHHIMSYSENKSEESLFNYGRNLVALNAIFLNLRICFDVYGTTNRHPGRFIAISSPRGGKSTESKYDYKLLGQWFVTKTTLSWSGEGSLYSKINAVKINSHGDLKLNEDV